MHGRLKVKTTAQQEADKKKERAVKLAGYRHAMAAILARRRDGHQDEEQLQLTQQVTIILSYHWSTGHNTELSLVSWPQY